MSCGADWGEFGDNMSVYTDFRSSTSEDRALGLQYPSQAASFQQFVFQSGVTEEAIAADVLADQTAGYK